jgi:hypothetical protein
MESVDMDPALVGPIVDIGVKIFSLLSSNMSAEQVAESRKEMVKGVFQVWDSLITQPGYENLTSDVSFYSDPQNQEIIQSATKIAPDFIALFQKPQTGFDYRSDPKTTETLADGFALGVSWFRRLLSK